MKIARIIAALLLVAMCLSMVVACTDDSGESKDNGDKPAETTATTTTSKVEGTQKPSDGSTTNKPGDSSTTPTGPVTTTKPVEVTTQPKEIPDNVTDTDYGVKFNVLAWIQTTKEYDLETLDDSADDVDAALYNRNRKVEDRLGIELLYNQISGGTTAYDDWSGVSGGSDAVNTFVETAHTTIAANMQAYDAIAAYTRCAGVLATRGDYHDLFTVDNIDTDMPWWPVEIISTNTVADKLYFATGDIATSLIYQMEFLIINQELAEEFSIDIDELQELALDGNGAKGGWTLDKLFEITANRYKKLDTEATGKTKNDQYGLYMCTHTLLDIFYMGAGLSYVEETDEGLVLSEDYAGTKSQNILKRFADAQKSDEGYGYYHQTMPVISQGNSLVYTANGAYLALDLRNATFTYRILPGPKYNDDQLDYYTALGFPHSLYSIPVDAKDSSISGAVLEVMASESWRQVTPVLFEKVFLYKLTNDVRDMEILELIRDRATWDIGRTFFEELGADTSSQVRLWRNMIVNKSSKIVGQVNQNKERWKGILDDLYGTFAG